MRSWLLRPLTWAGLALAIYWCLLFAATHAPTLPSVDAPRHTDKAAHLLGYAGLTFLAAAVVLRRSRWSRRAAFGLLVAVMAYGVLDELMQIPIPNRHASFADWMCDCLGALIGLILFRIVQKTLELYRESRWLSLARA